MAASDDSDVPDSGAVFTFGKSKFAENLPNKFWVKNDRVIQVACGDEHTALVAEGGRVFMFGPNDWGQLGVGTQKVASKPTCIRSLKHEKSRLVACGRSHTVIATESGNIYTFGANGEGQLGIDDVTVSNVPKHVQSLKPVPWKMLAAGCDHSMALDEGGRVYVWGSNGEGQLGMGKKAVIPAPTELDVGQPVTCISCGYYHSALVTESGQLYTFGENDGGKLGLDEDTDDASTPQLVRSIPGRVMAVSCGGSHTVALTDDGEVFVFGSGSSGQLGLGVSVMDSDSPSHLSLPFKVSQVCCGENFTAIVSEAGQLHTFGDGRHGKLALGPESFSNQFTPNRVDRFAKFYVDQVACGGCHMIIKATLISWNGHAGSSGQEEEEEEGEERKRSSVNGSLKGSSDFSLSGSFSARDRRRNEGPLPVSRPLPTLTGRQELPAIGAKLSESEGSSMRREPAPRLQRLKKIGHISGEEESEEEDRAVSSESRPVRRELPPIRGMPVPTPRTAEKEREEDMKTELTEKKKEKKKSKKEKKKKKGEVDDLNKEEDDEEDTSKTKNGKSSAKEKEDKRKKKKKGKMDQVYAEEEETKTQKTEEKEITEKSDEDGLKMEENEKGKNKQKDGGKKKETGTKKKSRLCSIL